MSSDWTPLDELGERIAETLGDGPSEEQMMLQRRDFLAQASAPRRTGRKLLGAAIGAAAAAVVAAVLAGVFNRTPQQETLPFWIGTEQSAGAEGSWVRADSAAQLPIRFQGGSEINLSADAAARIVSATTETVRIDLAGGKLYCSINPNRVTRWQVEAGPYTVLVTGTVFTTEWHPEADRLDVTVSRGSVLVSGANLTAHGVTLSVGDRLHVEGEQALIARNAAPEGDAPAVEATAARDTTADNPVSTENPSAETGTALTKTETPTVLKRKDRFRDDAPSSELEAALGSDDVERLWAFAMQARYRKNSAEAKSALLAIRKRFAGSNRAETAPFVLGRVLQELESNPAAAAKWFQRYLRENPNGPLAEEALGRLFDACDSAGQTDAAERHAKNYLDRYPRGLFAESARQVLSR